jgi:hypothetical protein
LRVALDAIRSFAQNSLLGLSRLILLRTIANTRQ